MRHLIVNSQDKERQLVDGVRIRENGGWVLLMPDRETASFNIMAESRSKEATVALADRYRTLVEQWQSD